MLIIIAREFINDPENDIMAIKTKLSDLSLIHISTCDNVHDTVMEYITDAVHDDLFPVGRLDIDTEGPVSYTHLDVYKRQV